VGVPKKTTGFFWVHTQVSEPWLCYMIADCTQYYSRVYVFQNIGAFGKH